MDRQILQLDVGASYRLEMKPIASSTFGEIWAAERCETGELVAIKQVRRDKMREAPPQLRHLWVDGLSREIDFLDGHRNCHLVTLLRRGELDGLPVMVLERMECSLAAFLDPKRQPGNRLDLMIVVEWLRQITEGIGVIHRAGLRHLDLKPDNLLLGEASQLGRKIKIADLGTSLATTSWNHIFAGTPGWQPREQFFPLRREGMIFYYETYPSSDFFALGLLLFFLLTGRQTCFARECVSLHAREQEYAAWTRRESPPPGFTETDRRVLLEALGVSSLTTDGHEEGPFVVEHTGGDHGEDTLVGDEQGGGTLVPGLVGGDYEADTIAPGLVGGNYEADTIAPGLVDNDYEEGPFVPGLVGGPLLASSPAREILALMETLLADSPEERPQSTAEILDRLAIIKERISRLPLKPEPVRNIPSGWRFPRWFRKTD